MRRYQVNALSTRMSTLPGLSAEEFARVTLKLEECLDLLDQLHLSDPATHVSLALDRLKNSYGAIPPTCEKERPSFRS